MDVSEAIEKRMSVRKFSNQEVSDELIKDIITYAGKAPSGNNAQPSRYVIVKDDKTKAELKENNIFPQDFVYTAPVLIVCCGDPKVYVKKSGLDESNENRALRDLSIASAFLVLRATELVLVTCYIGWQDKDKIKHVLNIPKDFVCPYTITLGYPAEKPEKRPRKNMDEILL